MRGVRGAGRSRVSSGVELKGISVGVNWRVSNNFFKSLGTCEGKAY